MLAADNNNFFRHCLCAALIWGACLGLLCVSGPAAAAAPDGSLETVRLQLKWRHQFQFAGYYAAKAQGYYAAEGLAVELREIDPARNVVDQVAAGAADYGVGDSGIVSEYANGKPIVALAAIFQHNPLVFISKPSSGIISPYEMAGKRIMFNAAGKDDAPLRAMLADAGLSRERYTHVPHTFSNADLLEGRVSVMSAYLTNEPFYFRQQGIPLNIINPQNYGFDFYGDLLFTSQQELAAHPGRAERFRRATLKGWRYALDHPEELVQLIHRDYARQRSLEHLRFEAAETRKLILPDLIPLGQIEAGRLRRAAETYARLHLARPLDERRLQQFIYGTPTQLDLTAAERAWLDRHPVIRLGVDRDFAPYEWVDRRGNYVGMVADYMHLLEQRLGVRFAIVKDRPWREILVMAQRGELDMIGAAVRTAERERYLSFSTPYVSNPAIIINDDRHGYIGDLERLAGKRVAVEHGYFVHELIARDHPAIRLVTADSVEQALALVAAGKADAYVGDAVSANYAIRKAGLLNLRFSGQTGYQSESAVAVSKRHPELLAIVDKALASMPPGEREAIINRWMGLRIEPGVSAAAMVRSGAIALLLFLLFAYWLLRLLREVKARQQSESRLTSLYTSMTIGFALHEVIRDSAGKVVDYRTIEVNPAFEQLTGKAREQWLRHTVRELLPQIEEYWIDSYGKVASSGEPCTMENYSQELGRWFFTYSYRPASERFAVLVQDITERKRAELREHARNEVLEQLAGGDALPGILQSIAHYVEQENPGMLCGILLLDEEAGCLRVGAAPSLPDFYREAVAALDLRDERCSCVLSLQQDARVVIEDVCKDARCPHYRDIVVRAGLGSCWSEPIRAAGGKLLGVFTIYHREAKAPGGDEISLIEHAASLAAIAIERSRSDEALQLAHMVYQNSAEAMIVTDDRNCIVAINPAFTEMTGYALEDVQGRDPKLLTSGRHDERFYQEMWLALATTGQWQGEIWNRRKSGEEFAEWLTINTIYDEDGKVHRRVALFSDITEKKRADALIWSQANYDPLTQLPNRRLFGDRLAQEIRKAQRDGQQFALLFLDLDRFKEVNDTLGHHMGDELLVEAARRIRSRVREADTVARLGGDEFTVILCELTDLTVIERVAQSIIAALNEPFTLGEDQAYVSVSIGITVYPHDAGSLDELLRNADQAMYAAKKEGRGRCSYFTPSMQQAAQIRVRLARDLRQALAAQQFEVYYQPIVELASGDIRKAEALLRWHHPEKGDISPAAFIPIAEDTGAIHDIGDWVFRTAAQQVAQWRLRYGADFQISVNKSPMQFHAEGRTHDHWIGYLRERGVEGGNIAIEITESLLLHADAGVTDKLLGFRDAGIQVAIDDFGTGYSSLAYLNKFDIDYLKIDQSFTRHLETDASSLALSEAIVGMAHKLGLKVVAEGVETPGQRDLLKHIGCDYAQGYLFARPLPAAAFEQMLQRGSVPA